MAETIGQIAYDASINTSQFKKDSAELDRTAKGVANGLGSNMEDGGNRAGAALTKFANVAKVALIATGTAIVGFGVFALKSAGDVEMLRASFDTMLGSAEAGAKLFTQLQTMANVTPFETTDLADASKTLLAFGIGVEDLLPDLKMLGDVSLGNKDKFNSLALAFGQVAAKGKLQGDDLRQLVSVGFNPLQKIAQSTGESMASLTDKMSAGEITFEMVSDEFKKATENGGQFFNGMAKGANTLPGLMSTLSDTFGITARAIVGLNEAGDVVAGSLLDRLKTGVTNLIPFLNEVGKTAGPLLTDALKKMEEILKNIIPPIIKVATQIGDYLIPKFQALWSSIKDTVIPIFNNLWKNILQPLAIFLGYTLVFAIGFVVDALKFMTDGAGFLIPVLAGIAAGIFAWNAYLIISQGATVLWTTITGLATAAQIAFNVALLSNPIGLVVAAVAGLVGGLALLWATTQTNTEKTDALTTATNNLKTAQDNLTTTSMTLNTANLGVITAKENEATATQHVIDMLNQYGANSPQYIKAQAELLVAHDNTTLAIDTQTEAKKKNDEALSDVAKKDIAVENAKKIETAAYDGAAAWRKQNEDFGILRSNLNSFNGSTFSYNIVGSQSGPKSPTGKASGGSVSANSPYFVGDNPDGSLNKTSELFVPRSAGTIVNSKDLASSFGGKTGSEIIYNIGTIEIGSEVDGERWLKKLTQNQEIISNGLTPTQRYA